VLRERREGDKTAGRLPDGLRRSGRFLDDLLRRLFLLAASGKEYGRTYDCK